MKIKILRNGGMILFMLGICFSPRLAFSQSANTEYFMGSSHTKTTFNPAKRPEKGYIGIPFLGNISFDYKTNTLNLEHFLFPGVLENGKTAWFLNEEVSYDQFMNGISTNLRSEQVSSDQIMSGLSKDNYLTLDVNLNILDFGFYVNDLFMFFDVSERVKGGLNLPKSVFDFMKQGVVSDVSSEGKTYVINDLRMDLTIFTQIGAGVSYPVRKDNSLVLGGKGKILLGNTNIQAKMNDAYLNFGKDKWSMRSQTSLQMNFPGMQVEYDENGEVDLDNIGQVGGISPADLFVFNGFGLGLDLGATFNPGKYLDIESFPAFLDNLTVSAAITDLGFIVWNNKTQYLVNDHNERTLVGGPISTDLEEAGPLFYNVVDSLKTLVVFKEAPSAKKSTALGARLNFGLEYALDQKLNLGLLSSTYLNPIKTISEFTLAGAYRPASGFELGLSYSFAYSDFQTFGMAIHLGRFLYIAGDYIIPHVNSLFIPTSSKAFNVHLGLAIPIGQKH